MPLSRIGRLSTRIDTLSARIEAVIAELPNDARGVGHPDSCPTAGPRADIDRNCSTGGGDAIRVDPAVEAACALSTVERLDEAPGIGALNAKDISGRDRTQDMTTLGEAAAAATKTGAFLGARYRRLARLGRKRTTLDRSRAFRPGDHLAPASQSDR